VSDDWIADALALEEWNRLTHEEQLEVAAWTRAVHLRWHIEHPTMVVACCLFMGTSAAAELTKIERGTQ
jgi:hypothetical protein